MCVCVCVCVWEIYIYIYMCEFSVYISVSIYTYKFSEYISSLSHRQHGFPWLSLSLHLSLSNICTVLIYGHLPSNLKNHPSKMNKTCRTLLEKQGQTHKWHSSIDLNIWTQQCLPTIKNELTSIYKSYWNHNYPHSWNEISFTYTYTDRK